MDPTHRWSIAVDGKVQKTFSTQQQSWTAFNAFREAHALMGSAARIQVLHVANDSDDYIHDSKSGETDSSSEPPTVEA